jgi:CheY-like chemotaxis protein
MLSGRSAGGQSGASGVDSVRAIIVLADDEPDLRAVFCEVLRRDGYEVWEACDGREALAMIAEHRPDLLILDVWMPVVNGFEVLDLLRDDPGSPALKVVILSNLGDADSRLEGFSAGVLDYWVKGLPLDEFRDRIRRVIATAPALYDPD